SRTTRSRRRSSSEPIYRRRWLGRFCVVRFATASGLSPRNCDRAAPLSRPENRARTSVWLVLLQRLRSTGLVLVALLLVAPLRAEVDKYEVYAVRFATIANFRVASLVAGADPTRRMDIAMTIWVLKGIDGRVAVVDSGFHREQWFRQFA